MPLSRKDEQIIKHLIDYCKEVDLAIATFKYVRQLESVPPLN